MGRQGFSIYFQINIPTLLLATYLLAFLTFKMVRFKAPFSLFQNQCLSASICG